jgi:hypothetical protein
MSYNKLGKMAFIWNGFFSSPFLATLPESVVQNLCTNILVTSRNLIWNLAELFVFDTGSQKHWRATDCLKQPIPVHHTGQTMLFIIPTFSTTLLQLKWSPVRHFLQFQYQKTADIIESIVWTDHTNKQPGARVAFPFSKFYFRIH